MLRVLRRDKRENFGNFSAGIGLPHLISMFQSSSLSSWFAEQHKSYIAWLMSKTTKTVVL